MDSVYVCRRSTCRHIVAAFTPTMDNKQLAELMKQFTLAGYRLELATDMEVQIEFDTHCKCNAPKTPPLIDWADRKVDPTTGELFEDTTSDGGVEIADVEAAGEDVTPEADEADEELRAEEEQEPEIDLQKIADDIDADEEPVGKAEEF